MNRIFTLFVVLLSLAYSPSGYSQNIQTIVGGFGDNGAATLALLKNPNNVTVDRTGNIFIADAGNRVIRKINPGGVITLYGGIPLSSGISGNNIPAINATLGSIAGVVTDTFGNLYIADKNTNTIRKINSTGIISDYANVSGSPYDIAIDKTGNLFVAVNSTNRIMKINTSAVVSVFAGNGTAGYSGNGGAATAAQLNQPTGVCVDNSGNVFIADNNNNRVRKVGTTGIISTYAGSGIIGYAGDGGPATAAHFNKVYGVGVDTSGNVYIADNGNNEIRMVNTSGIVTRVAGALFSGGFSGDGGPATAGRLNNPTGVKTDALGNYYIADNGNHRIRKVDATGTITSIAGTGNYRVDAYNGDGIPAVSAQLNAPFGIAYDTSYNLYIADRHNNRVRKVSTSGIITTVAGTGIGGYSGDSVAATNTTLSYPSDVATDRKGNLFICDYNNFRIRKVASDGTITTYAGNGTSGYSGDGSRADSASLLDPVSIALDKQGNLYISDGSGCRIRKVDTNQIITTFAGTGVSGYFGDGGMASAAQLRSHGICIDSKGNIYAADATNKRVRKIDTAGIITTVAGNGTTGVSGMGGPAIFASIDASSGVGVDDVGNIYINAPGRLFKVDTAGVIALFGGNGGGGFLGDGGPAALAGINPLWGIVFDTSGNIILSDGGNNRIRKIYNAAISITTPSTTTCTGITTTFTAVATAAPAYSIYYRWKKNGADVGTNSPVYTTAGLVSGDKIICSITDGPAGIAIATSNELTMTVVSPSASPGVGMETYPSGTQCAGTTVTCWPVSVVNGGTAPIYDWYKNAVHVFTGTNYVFIPNNSDIVYCKLRSSISCLIVDTANSAPRTFTITAPGVPTVGIEMYNSDTIVCTGNSVTCRTAGATFSSSPTYQWYKNGVQVFTGSSYYTFTPVNGDQVQCKMRTEHNCVVTDTAMSNVLTFTVNGPANPSVTILSIAGDTLCPGHTTTCMPTPTLGGTSPQYRWYKNGSQVGTASSYTFAPLAGDNIHCKLISNSNCVLVDTALSNHIIFSNKTPIFDTVSISVSPSDSICRNTTVTFTATITNGGTTPVIEWYKNGSKIDGAGSPTYTRTVQAADEFYCQVTSSECALPTPATSNKIKLTIKPAPVPTISVSVSPGNTICDSVPVTCTATITNGGTSPLLEWFRNDTNVFTGNPYLFMPENNDHVHCRLTSNAECVTTEEENSNSTYFYIGSLPELTISCTPGQVIFRGTSVTLTANTTGGMGSYAYQWIKNGEPIPGATNYTYTSNGFSTWDSVKCVLTVSGTCSGTVTSNTLVVNTYHGMKLYPNPNDGHFTINGNNFDANGDEVHLRVYTPSGRLVYEKTASFDAITFYTEVDMGRVVAPGVYILRLSYSLENLSFFFVVK